jgi:hypothetical protein
MIGSARHIDSQPHFTHELLPFAGVCLIAGRVFIVDLCTWPQG